MLCSFRSLLWLDLPWFALLRESRQESWILAPHLAPLFRRRSRRAGAAVKERVALLLLGGPLPPPERPKEKLQGRLGPRQLSKALRPGKRRRENPTSPVLPLDEVCMLILIERFLAPRVPPGPSRASTTPLFPRARGVRELRGRRAAVSLGRPAGRPLVASPHPTRPTHPTRSWGEPPAAPTTPRGAPGADPRPSTLPPATWSSPGTSSRAWLLSRQPPWPSPTSPRGRAPPLRGGSPAGTAPAWDPAAPPGRFALGSTPVQWRAPPAGCALPHRGRAGAACQGGGRSATACESQRSPLGPTGEPPRPPRLLIGAGRAAPFVALFRAARPGSVSSSEQAPPGPRRRGPRQPPPPPALRADPPVQAALPVRGRAPCAPGALGPSGAG